MWRVLRLFVCPRSFGFTTFAWFAPLVASQEDQRALWHDLDRCRQRRRLYPYDTAWTLHEQNVSEKLRSLANYKEQLRCETMGGSILLVAGDQWISCVCCYPDLVVGTGSPGWPRLPSSWECLTECIRRSVLYFDATHRRDFWAMKTAWCSSSSRTSGTSMT